MFEKYKKVYKADYEKWYKENEAYRERVAADQDRLKFHLMPKTGWLNDPNGLCQFNGTYHIYYQYTPFEPTGELKTWGQEFRRVLFRSGSSFFQAEDGIRDSSVTGVQTCALPI